MECALIPWLTRHQAVHACSSQSGHILREPRLCCACLLRAPLCAVYCLMFVMLSSSQGGATRFDHLDIKVQPQRGKALLFFPAFSGGKSDAR